MSGSRILYAFAAAAALIFCVFYTGWLAFYLLAIIILTPVFSLLLSLPGILSLRVQISCAALAEKDGKLEATLEIKSRVRYPLRQLRAKLTVKNRFTGSIEDDMLKFDAVGSMTVDIPFVANQCGQLHISLRKLRAYDYTGVFSIPLRLSDAVLVTILPREREPEVKYSLPGKFTGRRLIARPAGTFAEDHDIRPHRRGDPMSSIHWKLTAKTGKLLVKEPLTPSNQKIKISFDNEGDPARVENELGELIWLVNKLLEIQMPPQVFYYSADGALKAETLFSRRELDALIAEVLSSRPPAEAAGRASRCCTDADWHRHITLPKGAEQA